MPILCSESLVQEKKDQQSVLGNTVFVRIRAAGDTFLDQCTETAGSS